MIAAAFSEAEARDLHHLRTWVVLVDGADHQLALIRAEAARRGVTIHVIIDMWGIHLTGVAPAQSVALGRSDPAELRPTTRSDDVQLLKLLRLRE
jgi:hypothetical protein